MNATPMSQGMSADPQTGQRGRRRNALWRRDVSLGVKELELHARLKMDGRPKSGRCGDYVYYVRKGRQCWHRYVVPKDPRSPAQLRLRAAFGAASKAWSLSEPLTEQQRDPWYTVGAKVQSRPRLGQSGPLTGQQYFVGRNCAKEQLDLGMLVEPPKWERKNAEGSEEPNLPRKSNNPRELPNPPGGLAGPAPLLARPSAVKAWGV